MKNLFIALCSIVILSSCEGDKKGNLVVTGTVDGLKVGKLYLQQLQDTTLINVDSVIVDGEAPFKMTATVDEPQLMYFYLDKKDGSIYDDRLTFFAEDTVITIHTSLDEFETGATITGSKNQELYQNYRTVNKQLDKQYTELYKRSLTMGNLETVSQDSIDSLSNDLDKHLKKKVGYVINFAMRNKDYEVAPFILLQQGHDANPVYLDSAYNMMPKKIQNSRYGKQLSEFIKEKKESL